MLPRLVLGATNVKRGSTDLTQFDIMVAQQKLTLGVAHWCGAVATATGLMKHYRSMVILDFLDQLQRRLRRVYFFLHASISGLIVYEI
jgi:hypothetical protein